MNHFEGPVSAAPPQNERQDRLASLLAAVQGLLSPENKSRYKHPDDAIWAALTNASIRDLADRKKWFRELKIALASQKTDLPKISAAEQRRREIFLRDAAEHERLHGPDEREDEAA